MKTIKANHKAEYEPIADLVTYRAMPTKGIAMNQLDPFIFLNHHGWQQYEPTIMVCLSGHIRIGVLKP
jgi:hypothetical protein